MNPAHTAPLVQDGLPRGRPEDHGVSSDAVLAYLDSVAAANHELHSFMLCRHGHVISEGWWAPYRPGRIQMTHSLTKSVAACGVGLAIAEGRFNYDDKVISFFPDELPSIVDDKLAAMTVRDLLTMRTGHASNVSGAVWRQIKTSWVAEFFKIPLAYDPGTTAVYTSAASYMLSAIITRTTAQKLRDYLEPRLFAPLGISGIEWEEGPDGITPGGNGLSWKTSDALKLGILHAQSGTWQDKQVLDPEWIREATVPRAQCTQGTYGYHWWIGPEGTGGAYYAAGMFGQMAIVFPQHDAVLAVTAATKGSLDLLPNIWRAFPRAFSSAGSPGAAANKQLRERTAALSLMPPIVPSHSPEAENISGRVYRMADNEDGVSQIQFRFEADRCVFSLTDQRGRHEIQVGLRDWIDGYTGMTGNKLHHQYQKDRMRVIASGRWLDERTFEMTWMFPESVFRDTVVCRFEGEHVTFDRSVNVNSAALSRPTLSGQMA